MSHPIKATLLSLLLILPSACTSAENNHASQSSSTPSAPVQAAASAPQTSALEAETVLWKISKTGQPDSYLLGTMHVGKKDSHLRDSFQAALNNSKQLLVETEAADETYLEQHPEIAQAISQTMLHPKPLKDTVGSQRLAAIRPKFASSPIVGKLTPMLDDNMPLAPWVVSFYLSYTFIPSDYIMEKGVDNLLIAKAQQQNKKIIGLEDATFALAMLRDNTPDDVAIRGIDDWLAHETDLRRETQEMLNQYEQGHISQLWQNAHGEALIRYVNPQDREISKKVGDELLLKQRNQHWLPKLLTELPKNSSVVAVGTAHLFGEHGLIALLRNNGYTVTPLPM